MGTGTPVKERTGTPPPRPHLQRRGHTRQTASRRWYCSVKERSDEGAMYRWGISWITPDYAEAVTAMAKERDGASGTSSASYSRSARKAEGRLEQADAPATAAGSRRLR